MDLYLDDPMLWLKHPVEGRGWRRGKSLRCPGAKRRECAYLKRKAHKKCRKAAKEALRSIRPKAQKRPASGRDID